MFALIPQNALASSIMFIGILVVHFHDTCVLYDLGSMHLDVFSFFASCFGKDLVLLD